MGGAKLVPELRFDGFPEDWSVKRIEKIEK